MRTMSASVFAIFVGASMAPAADRLDELFASWEKAQVGIQSLVVEFTLETPDWIDNTTELSHGSFRLLRSPKKESCASYDIRTEGTDGKQVHESGLLIDRSIYVLHHGTKQATRSDFAAGELQPFLEKWFHPTVILLDRKRTEEKWNLEVVKKDEWYTYLVMTTKQSNHSARFRFMPGADLIRIALMNKATPNMAQDMPCRIEYTDARQRQTFNIQVWRLNGPNPPKPEEFTMPEKLSGWTVNQPPSPAVLLPPAQPKK